jgi:hypothetical protein
MRRHVSTINGPWRWQDFPQHDVPRRFASCQRRINVLAGLDVERQSTDDAEYAGARDEGDSHENVQLVWLDRDNVRQAGIEDEACVCPAANDNGEREKDRELSGLIAIARVE